MSNVCILLTTEFPYSHGEPFLEYELEHLSIRFDEIHIFTMYGQLADKPTRSIPSNFKVHPLGMNKRTTLKYIFKGLFTIINKFDRRHFFSRNILRIFFSSGKSNDVFRRVLKALPPISKEDKVLIYSYWLNYPCYAGIKLKLHLLKNDIVTSCKVVSRAHGYDLFSERSTHNYLPLQKYNLMNLDMVAPCSKIGTEYLIKKYGNIPNIHTSYLGVTKGGSSASLKAKVFLTLSWFYPVKRMAFFARAFVLFLHENPGWKWVAIGGIGSESQEVKKIIREQHVDNNVEFYGALAHDEVMSYLSNHKVSYLVNTSYSEGIPVSMMEAQARCIPCIGTDVGGVSELIGSDNGFLLERDIDDIDLANQLSIAANLETNTYNKLSRNSYMNWSLKFNSFDNFNSWADKIFTLTIKEGA